MKISPTSQASYEFACHSAACAPPPAGTGGSKGGGKGKVSGHLAAKIASDFPSRTYGSKTNLPKGMFGGNHDKTTHHEWKDGFKVEQTTRTKNGKGKEHTFTVVTHPKGWQAELSGHANPLKVRRAVMGGKFKNESDFNTKLNAQFP